MIRTQLIALLLGAARALGWREPEVPPPPKTEAGPPPTGPR